MPRVKKTTRITDQPDPFKATKFFAPGKRPRSVPVDLLAAGKVYGESQAGHSCTPPKKRVKGKDVAGPMRPCHVELAFLGAKHSKKRGSAPGIYIRACETAKENGILVPVKNHEEARSVAEKICACRSGGGSTKACAEELRAQAPLSGARRARRR